MSLRGRGRRRGGRPLNAEVNIINLVDVMLVLLIIFMVTAPILQSGIAIKLPKSSTRSSSSPETVTITVQQSGRVAIGDQSESWNDFVTGFPILVNAKHVTGVNIRSDTRAAMGDVVRVLDQVRRAGIEKINLVTESATQ